MQTFKKFLTEAVATKRKGIVHFDKMKPLEFIETVMEWKKQFGAILKNDSVDISLKVDGAGFRFGKDREDKFFIESSRSGPIYTSNAFSSFAKSKGADDEKLARAYLYDDMFSVLSRSRLAEIVPIDCKIVCEMLFNPMSQDLGKTRKFVSIAYDKGKLGDQMTIVLIQAMNATTGKLWGKVDTENLFKALMRAGNKDIKVITSGLGFGTIDVSVSANDLEGLIGSYPDYKSLLTSRKAVDRARKEILTQSIEQIKAAIARNIIGHPFVGRDILGKEEEGLVLNIRGSLYKIQSSVYKSKLKNKS
jgi:hypothetical protein